MNKITLKKTGDMIVNGAAIGATGFHISKSTEGDAVVTVQFVADELDVEVGTEDFMWNNQPFPRDEGKIYTNKDFMDALDDAHGQPLTQAEELSRQIAERLSKAKFQLSP